MEILLSRRSLAVVAGMNQLNDHADPTQLNAKNVMHYVKKSQ